MGISFVAKVAIIGILGIVLFSAGILEHAVFPSYYLEKLKEKLKIRSDSPTFPGWVEPSIPIYLQFYFFSINNPDDFASNNVSPSLQQFGPYTFRQHLFKDNITFLKDSPIVTYYLRKWFHFEPDMSAGNLTDVVTIPNVPLLSLAHRVESSRTTTNMFILNQLIRIHKSEPFVTRTVEELLFTGYEDPLMKRLGALRRQEILPDGRFAFHYKKNGTGTYFAVNTGMQNTKDLARVIAWTSILNEPTFDYTKYLQLNYWNNTLCDSITGTDGGQFPPPVGKDTRLNLFTTDLCRSIYLDYEMETSVGALNTLRFSLPDSLLANPSLNPDNKCFCPKTECYGSGLLSLSACKNGAPIVVSPPHFYKSDLPYSTKIANLMRPNKQEHETFLDIEPATGLTLRAAKRIQVNIAIKAFKDFKNLKQLPQMIYPIFWINESFVITPDKVERLESVLIKFPKLARTIGISFLSAGVVILVLLLQYLVFKACRNSKAKKVQIQPIPSLPSSHYVKFPTRKRLPSEYLNIVENEKIPSEPCY